MSHLEALVAQPSREKEKSEGRDTKETAEETALTRTIIALDTASAEFHRSDWADKIFWGPLGLEKPKVSPLLLRLPA